MKRPSNIDTSLEYDLDRLIFELSLCTTEPVQVTENLTLSQDASITYKFIGGGGRGETITLEICVQKDDPDWFNWSFNCGEWSGNDPISTMALTDVLDQFNYAYKGPK